MRKDLGWSIRPEVAANQAVAKNNPEWKPRGRLAVKKVLQAFVPETWKVSSKSKVWSQQKRLARYSEDRLFSDILAPVSRRPRWQSLEQTLVIADREISKVYGLQVVPEGGHKSVEGAQATQDVFDNICRENGIDGALVFARGAFVEQLCKRSAMVDLVVLDRAAFSSGRNDKAASAELHALVRHCPRPVLVAADQPSSLQRILLVYDGQSQESLFVATYMAERWGAALVVLWASLKGNVSEKTMSHTSKYLEMHEIEATMISEDGAENDIISRTAKDHNSDLIIIGGNDSGFLHKRSLIDSTFQLIDLLDRPVLICS